MISQLLWLALIIFFILLPLLVVLGSSAGLLAAVRWLRVNPDFAKVTIKVLGAAVVAVAAIAFLVNTANSNEAAMRDDAYFTRTAERGPDLVEWKPIPVVPVVPQSLQCAEIFSGQASPAITKVELQSAEVLRVTVTIPFDCEPSPRARIAWSSEFIDGPSSALSEVEVTSAPNPDNRYETIYVVVVPSKTGYLAISYDYSWDTFVLLDA